MVNVCLVGLGYWGLNIFRNLLELNGIEITIKCVCDLDPNVLAPYSRRYGQIQFTSELNSPLLFEDSVDAVIIATPTKSHFELAKRALINGKHVFVEKPLTDDLNEAGELLALADKFDRILMVGHTFLYHGAVRKIKEIIRSGEIGTPLHFFSTRMNLGKFQNDTNVSWDLAVHDLSILNFLIDEKPVSVSASLAKHFENLTADTFSMQLKYASNFSASIGVSWISPLKIRQTIIVGTKKMIYYDDNNVLERVRLYDTCVELREILGPEAKTALRVEYRAGDIHSPTIDNSEALRTELKSFVAGVNGGPVESDGVFALKVIEILAAANRSAVNSGREVALI